MGRVLLGAGLGQGTATDGLHRQTTYGFRSSVMIFQRNSSPSGTAITALTPRKRSLQSPARQLQCVSGLPVHQGALPAATVRVVLDPSRTLVGPPLKGPDANACEEEFERSNIFGEVGRRGDDVALVPPARVGTRPSGSVDADLDLIPVAQLTRQ